MLKQIWGVFHFLFKQLCEMFVCELMVAMFGDVLVSSFTIFTLLSNETSIVARKPVSCVSAEVFLNVRASYKLKFQM